MTEHDNADEVTRLRAEVARLKRNTAGLYERTHAAEAAVARVRELADILAEVETGISPEARAWAHWAAERIYATLDPASTATRSVSAPADDKGTGTGSAPSEGHGEARAQVARATALIDRWDGEIGAREDNQHPAAVRAVEACLNDLRAALALYDHAGCCTCCGGTGSDNHCAGMCWDCRGTGHPHAPEDGS
jgi:hypothetical protein